MVMWKRLTKSGDLTTTCSNSEKVSLPSLMTSHSATTRVAIASNFSSGSLSPVRKGGIEGERGGGEGE